jgi:Tfp pilus assembly protein PilV
VKRHGYSLLEAVVSLFLLLMCFLVVINLFHTGLGYGNRVQNQQLATTLAEGQLEAIRAWSGQLNGTVYNFDNPGLAIYNTSTTDSQLGDFNITTTVTPTTLYSSCSQLELGVVPSAPYVQPRTIRQGAQKVQVTVSWDQGSRQLSLVTLMARPILYFQAPPLAINVTTTGPTTLGHAASANFTAIGYDSNNTPIADLFFVWDVYAVNATATLTQARDGSIATLTNQIYIPPFSATQTPPFLGVPAPVSGNLFVRATARYHGQTLSANSTLMTLTSP